MICVVVGMPRAGAVRSTLELGYSMRYLVKAIAASLLAAAAGGMAIAPETSPSADTLREPREVHLRNIRQLTFGGGNAEAYWSEDGRRLIFQSTRDGWPCDQQYVLEMATGAVHRVSTGAGRTTCGYFYDRDRRVLFSSTHLGGDACPPPPDFSQGYVWSLHPSYDIFTAAPDGSDLWRLTRTPGSLRERG